MKNQLNSRKPMAHPSTLESQGAFVVPTWGWRKVTPASIARNLPNWGWAWSWVSSWRKRWLSWNWSR